MITDDLSNLLKSVHDEASFLRFVDLLTEDARVHLQEQWTSETISDFLQAAHAWAHDSEFGHRPGPKSDNPWQLFALFLWAGRIYE